jgi:hypothetical protein
MLPGTLGSVRETMRFANAARTLNAQTIRNYLQACFAAGTPILWEQGAKPVEEFQPGDRVWARPENAPHAPVELRQIEEVFVNYAPIWHVHVGGHIIRTTDELEGTDMEVCINFHRGYASVDVRSAITDMCSDKFLRIARELITLLAPTYGIGYRREFWLGPALYAVGLCCGEISEEEGLRISQWTTVSNNKLFWFLRDVYPWNFLTARSPNARDGDSVAMALVRGCTNPKLSEGRSSLTPRVGINRLK